MGRISALTELTSLASDDYLVVLDSSANIAKKITIANAFGIPTLGYTAAGESWTYASATTITVPTDATTKYEEGNIIKITQTTGGTKYGVIITVAATLLTIFWLGGATLANEAITSPFYSSNATPLGAGQLTPLSISNPVKFSTYLSANQTGIVDNTLTKVTFNSELFDTGSNFASNKFTAPVAGFYQINVHIQSSASGNNGVASTIFLYKNGASINNGGGLYPTNGAGNSPTFFGDITQLVQLAAGDYLEVYITQDVISGTITVGGGAGISYFSGFLVSNT